MTAILDGRVCVVTGSSGGLGGAVIRRLWTAGANIVAVTRSTAVGPPSAARSTEQRFVSVTADLSREGEAERIVEQATVEFGVANVLINAAAVQGPIGPLEANDPVEWEQTLRVNLVAPVMLCRMLLPLMPAGGKVINISGGGATAARPGFSAYGTAKAALVRFSETLAEELRSRRIDVNAVAPGVMKTRLLQNIISAGADRVSGRELQVATGATLDACDRAAELCLFLASPESDGITGKLISAVWDPWRELPQHLDDLRKTDVYTIRRIVPADRGLDWGRD